MGEKVTYKVPGELLQAITDYLSRKPYVEVYKLIGELLKLKECKEETEDAGTYEEGTPEK